MSCLAEVDAEDQETPLLEADARRVFRTKNAAPGVEIRRHQKSPNTPVFLGLKLAPGTLPAKARAVPGGDTTL